MKKIKLILFLMLAAALFGCKNSAGNNDDNTANQNNFEAGWYKYTISASGTTKQYFLCYDANKVLTRVGSEESEYTGTVFETYKNNEGFSYDTLSKSQDSYATFKKISDSELPEWAKKEDEETWLYVKDIQTVNDFIGKFKYTDNDKNIYVVIVLAPENSESSITAYKNNTQIDKIIISDHEFHCEYKNENKPNATVKIWQIIKHQDELPESLSFLYTGNQNSIELHVSEYFTKQEPEKLVLYNSYLKEKTTWYQISHGWE